MYINRFHPCNYKTTYVPCLTPGCNNKHLDKQINHFAANLKYALMKDPNATLKLECSICGKTSEYTYELIIKMMPNEMLPIPLPHNHIWAILLFELETADSMNERGFFGERLLVYLSREQNMQWSGELLSESQFAPSLQRGYIIGGNILNNHYVCEYVVQSNKPCALPLKDVPTGSDFGIFFVPKKGNVTNLQCANLFCSNPSCAHIFGLQYSELKKHIEEQSKTQSQKYGDTVAGYCFLLSCELCGSAIFGDLSSFDNLFKI